MISNKVDFEAYNPRRIKSVFLGLVFWITLTIAPCVYVYTFISTLKYKSNLHI